MKAIIYMGLITTILSLIGCSGKNNETDKDTEGFNGQIAQSIEDFKNRTIYTKLTEEIIKSTSDDNLLQAVFDNLTEKLPEDYNKEFEIVAAWNESRQAIYMIWVLEAEVNNGGYNQFYFNSGGQFYKKLPKALQLVGAIRFADLTQRANGMFEIHNEKIKEHQDGSLEGFSESYEENPLNDLDTEFYGLYELEDLQQIQVGYIRANKEEFIDK